LPPQIIYFLIGYSGTLIVLNGPENSAICKSKNL
jgi:hypothetical protein